MSKQVVVVTDSFGNKTEHEGIAHVEVIDGALWLTDSKDKTSAVIRSWERAERVELVETSENAEPDLEPVEVDLLPLGRLQVFIDEAQQPLQEPWHVQYNAALERFRKTLVKAREGVERKATGGCPCGRCGGDR